MGLGFSLEENIDTKGKDDQKEESFEEKKNKHRKYYAGIVLGLILFIVILQLCIE